MKGVLVFPPVHDFSMPYLAGPILKGFIEQNEPGIKLTCVDLNLEFFQTALADYDHRLLAYREAVDSPDLVNAVSAAVTHQNAALVALKNFASSLHPGHKWSMRNYSAPYERDHFASVAQYSSHESPYDKLFIRFLDRFPDPAYMAVSLTVDDQLLPTFRLLRLARARWTNVPLILGGNLINRIGRFISRSELLQFSDYVVLREGERPFLGLLRHLRNPASTPLIDPRVIDLSSERIPELSVLDSLSSELHTDIQQLDFKADFSDLSVQSYFSAKPILPILLSRKCYWGKCEFCTIHSAWDPSHRRRLASAVADEISSLSTKYGVRFFRVVDEACPPDLLKEVSEIVVAAGISVILEIYGILEKRFLLPDLVSSIARGGCRQIFFGLESSNPDIVRSMSKQINRTAKVDQILASTASYGIHNYVFTMFGYPGDTIDSQRRTVDYVTRDRNIHTTVVSNFVAELEAPYAKRNVSDLRHDGRMTEKFSEIRCDGRFVSNVERAAKEAESALREIYKRRPDLALTSLLNDETRLDLSSRFGPDFAQQAVTRDPSIAQQLSGAFKQHADERIRRRLT